MGTQTSKYTNGEVAGTEIIKAQVQGGNDISEFRINVKVPDLYNMGVSDSYRLTGRTQTHPFNHYGTWETLTGLFMIAEKYFGLTGTTLGINDMSLEWGGGFDIFGNWLKDISYQQCTQSGHGHCTHRTGEDVDIDRRVYDKEENKYIEIWCLEDEDLKKIVEKNFGTLRCESGGRKHIDF